MRKIIVGEFISLDGVVEAPDQWHFPYVNEELFAAMWSQMAAVDTMLLGRVTYESYAGAFANAPADDQVAAQMNRPAPVRGGGAAVTARAGGVQHPPHGRDPPALPDAMTPLDARP